MCKKGTKSFQPISDEELAKKIEILSELKDQLDNKIQFKLMVVTPSKAAEWLKKNTKNRNAKDRGNSYGRQMADGVWDFNGQPIIISDKGNLLDGGGRCTGIVNSNSAILSVVIEGVPETAFKTMDAIKARTAKDVLEASHILSEEKQGVVGHVASMGKMILEWNAERYGSHGAATTRTTACSLEVQNYIEKNLEKMRECAKAAIPMHGAHREQLMPSPRYFAAYMGYLVITKGWDLSDVIPFFEELTNPASTIRESTHPIAALRMELSKAMVRAKKITDEERFHMFARAWNCYKKEKPIKRFSQKAGNDVPMDKSEFIASNVEHLELVASMAL